MTENLTEVKKAVEGVREKLMTPMKRGTFLKYAGATAAATGLILTGCKDDDNDNGPTTIDLGSGDTGILNYAYLLEQLEAAFYTKVVASPFTGMSTVETTLLTEIRDHELAHRDFLKAAITTGRISDSVEFDVSSIDFTSRDKVLAAAKTFEDLGVSAYNGAGKLIVSPDYLLIAGKIVSVEARHASAIRDLISPNTTSFAGDDVVTTDKGLDGAKTPTEVLTAASVYVKGTVKFDKLPTT